MKRLLGTYLLSLALCACGGDDDKDAETVSWEGTDPHLRVVGTLNGEDLDITLTGADAANATILWCEREYYVPNSAGGEPDYANGTLVEVKVDAKLTVAGEARQMELELKRHNLQADTVGDAISVVPRSETADPAPNQMWIEWEWGDDFEQAAQSGTVTLKHFTGTPDSTGLVIPEGEGSVGALIEASWSTSEVLSISFTAPCTTNAVEFAQ